MRRSARLWIAAFGFALAAHAAALIGLFYVAPASGAYNAGTGGIEVALGPSGSAAGAEVAEAPAEPVEEAAPETAAPETAEPVEAIEETPVEAVPQEPVEPEMVREAVPLVEETEPVEPVEAETVPVATPKPRPEPPVRRTEPAPEAEPKPEREIAAAPPASVAGTGRSGTADGTETGEAADRAAGGLPGVAPDYASMLQAWLERHKTYPRGARVRRQEGQVLLYFAMDRDGRVLAQRIRRSSGHALLDEEALAMLERAAPLPPFPPDYGRDRLELVVPVRFHLKDLR